LLELVCASSKSIDTWSAADKQSLLDEASEMLRELDGAMFTGCDMNTSTDDMAYLFEKCPCVYFNYLSPSDPARARARATLRPRAALFSLSISHTHHDPRVLSLSLFLSAWHRDPASMSAEDAA